MNNKVVKGSVVSFNDWRENQDDRSLKEYLNVLSFHELVNEAEDTIRELNTNDSAGPELTRKSRQILKEFNNRLGGEISSMRGLQTL